jgi:hypothetical protein
VKLADVLKFLEQFPTPVSLRVQQAPIDLIGEAVLAGAHERSCRDVQSGPFSTFVLKHDHIELLLELLCEDAKSIKSDVKTAAYHGLTLSAYRALKRRP